METVITAKGTEFKTDMVAENLSPARLYIRIVQASMAEVASAFSDKAEIVAIQYGDRILSGYTRLVAIVPEGNAIKVILGRE